MFDDSFASNTTNDIVPIIPPLFTIKVECQHCQTAFQTSRVRPSFRKVIKTDLDFCQHYKDINPEYYISRTCPFCGYTTTENFTPISAPKMHDIIDERITKHWIIQDFGGERTWSQALQSIKLALVCAQIKLEPPIIIAELLHHIAWMYRYADKKQEEEKFLKFALDTYNEAISTIRDEKKASRVLFTAAVIYRMLGDDNEAVKLFGKIVNDKSVSDSGIITAARQNWQEIRQNMTNNRRP